jgi:hypothetical protein
VAPAAVVEALDVLEDRVRKLDAGVPALLVEQFGLHPGPERLDDGVIPRRQLRPIPLLRSESCGVTHPFHPWSGREFVFVAVRQTWAEDRVFFLDSDGRQHSLPAGWTDAAGLDVFVTVAAGRCPFRVTGV